MDASSTSSSDVDDEEAEKIRSVAVDYAAVAGVAAKFSCKTNKKKDNSAFTEDKSAASSLKFYQTRARESLYEYLDKTFDIALIKHEEIQPLKARSLNDAEDVGFHLFKRAPCGLSDKRQLQEAPKRKLQECNPDEGSEMYLSKITAAAIDGTTVALHAEKAKAKALSSWALHQAKEREEKQKEEERIAVLKVQRGEQWLPSVAKHMQINSPLRVSNSSCTPGEGPRSFRSKRMSKKKISKAEAPVVKKISSAS